MQNLDPMYGRKKYGIQLVPIDFKSAINCERRKKHSLNFGGGSGRLF